MSKEDDVTVGAQPPYKTKGDRGSLYKDIVDAAIANPNEWVSMKVESQGKNPAAVSVNNSASKMGRAVAEITYRNGVLFIRYHGVEG